MSTPLVTERWSARKFKRNRSAGRGWDVTGVVDEDAARSAVGAEAALGAKHPLDSRLWIVNYPEVDRTGPASYYVNAEYAVPKAGTYQPDRDPLDQPIDFEWGRGTVSEPAEVDADGTLVTNSAGFPFDNPPSIEYPYQILNCYRNEATYDIAKAIAYEGKYNTDTFSIPLTPGTVAPGIALCVAYRPTARFNELSTYIPVVYTFWLRPGRHLDADGIWDSWKWRLRDQGYMGWYNSSGLKPGAILGANNQRIVQPALLDGTGKPLNSTYQIETGATAGTTPASYQTLAPKLLENTGSAVFLKYKRYGGSPFSGLNLFF